MSEELTLLPCPFCGSRDVEVQGKPAILDALDSVCCNECTADAPYPAWNTRAQLPSRGGEAVEVVGYLDAHDCLWNETTHPDRMIPLMTVGQHQRILAAATHPADQVAEGVAVPVQLLKIIEQSWRIPNGCPKSVSEEVGEIISNGLAELRALLAKSEGAKK